jgi:undecaprenyl diphosphate synthase
VDFLVSIGAGERLTGVLLWHCAYAEFLFQPQAWWRSTSADFEAAFADYAQRCRKFGGLA